MNSFYISCLNLQSFFLSIKRTIHFQFFLSSLVSIHIILHILRRLNPVKSNPSHGVSITLVPNPLVF